jgi:hypothetical protein
LIGGAAAGALPVATETFLGDAAAFGGPLTTIGGTNIEGFSGLGGSSFNAPGGLGGSVPLPGSPAAVPGALPGGSVVPTGGVTPASNEIQSSAGGGDLLNLSGGDPLAPGDTIGSVPPTSTASSGDMLSPLSTGGNQSGDLSQGAGLGAKSVPTTGAPPASSFASNNFGSAAPAGGPSPAAAAGGAPAAAKGAASGGGGFDWMKAATLGIGAAPLALTLAKGESPLPPQAGQLASANAGLQNFANTALTNVTNNTTNPAQSAQLSADRQGLVNQWRQALFNQGVQNPEADSRWPQIMAQIDQQIAQETQSFIQTNLQAALSASGQASTNLTNLANMQIAQDTSFTNAISNASRALGGVAALSGR